MGRAYQVTTIAGKGRNGFKDGNALEAMFDCPMGICTSGDGKLYVTDKSNHRIRILSHNQVTTIAGNGQQGFKDGNAFEAMFSLPRGISISNDGKLYVADTHNHRIRMIYFNYVITIAGNGQQGFKDGNALEAMFSLPTGLCCSNDGRVYVTDVKNYRIRMIHNNQVTTIAGNGQQGFKDGNALEAMFDYPFGICISTQGKLYVSDVQNHRVRMIYNNQVTTIAGNGETGLKDGNALKARIPFPTGIRISQDGRLYISDTQNHVIRMIYNHRVITIAGNGEKGFKDGKALEANFSNPYLICTSNDGKLYVADGYNHRIRMISNTKISHRYFQSFGFASLFDMQNAFCDCQISFNGITYHLHRVLANVRCSLLFDQSYFSLIEKANISNKSFESFLTFCIQTN